MFKSKQEMESTISTFKEEGKPLPQYLVVTSTSENDQKDKK